MNYKKNNFELRTVCNESVLIAQGVENLDFGKIISLNETAAYLWERLAEEPFDAEKMAELLTQEYEVDKSRALEDSQTLLAQWSENKIVSPCE